MKKIIILANFATFVHACNTGDATAFIIAVAWFACTCYKDIYKIWYKILL